MKRAGLRAAGQFVPWPAVGSGVDVSWLVSSAEASAGCVPGGQPEVPASWMRYRYASDSAQDWAGEAGLRQVSDRPQSRASHASSCNGSGMQDFSRQRIIRAVVYVGIMQAGKKRLTPRPTAQPRLCLTSAHDRAWTWLRALSAIPHLQRNSIVPIRGIRDLKLAMAWLNCHDQSSRVLAQLLCHRRYIILAPRSHMQVIEHWIGNLFVCPRVMHRPARILTAFDINSYFGWHT